MPSVSASSSRGEVHLPRAAGTFPLFGMGELLGETAVSTQLKTWHAHFPMSEAPNGFPGPRFSALYRIRSCQASFLVHLMV